MSTKYCDPCLYSPAASFTASVSATTLTVSEVTSGKISLGAQIICAGFTNAVPLHITGYGTGSGGTGTYTLKHANNGTVASQAMTSVHGAPLNVATWGECQDGDGTAKTAATPSTAEIVFTGVPSSGSIYVMGVAVTAAWSTNADTCANNLATAINALTTTAIGPASFTKKAQVRNHLYARGPASGAPTGTCQVMTRQGSADHAGLVCFTHTLNNVSSSGTVNFSGGTGGAWGWLFNHSAAIWPSAIAQELYGLWATEFVYTGAVAGGDVVKVRAGKTIHRLSSTSLTRTIPPMGDATAPVVFEIDDGTEWPEDGVEPVLTYSITAAGNMLGYNAATSTSFVDILAKWYAPERSNLVMEVFAYVTGGASAKQSVTVGYPVRYINIDFSGRATALAVQGVWVVDNGNAITADRVTTFLNSRFVTDQQGQQFVGGTNAGGAYFIGCTFEQRTPTAPQNGVVNPGYGNTARWLFLGCNFKGFVSGSRLHVATSWPDGFECSFLNCDFGNVTERTGVVPAIANSISRSLPHCQGSSQRGLRDFFFENPAGLCEWNSSKGYPTLNATLLGTTTHWSLYAVTSTYVTNLGKTSPFALPPINKWNTLESGSRTVKVQLLLESTLTWSCSDISILLSYTDSAGNYVMTDSYDQLSSPLTASEASWSSTSYNGQSWTPLEFSTVIDVKKDTEVTAIVRLHSSVANNTLGVFIDPEILLT